MRLTGARVALNGVDSERLDVSIRCGRILRFDVRTEDPFELDLTGHLLLPGLINSHDHLEFNLFPRIPGGPHANYVEWASSVFHRDRSPLREHLRVGKTMRLMWGGLKNLLSGVTTVSHHNPYQPEVFERGFPVRVVKRFGWAHSLHFTHDLAERFQSTPADWPFLVHAAEGTDVLARAEIPKLANAGVLSNRTAVVHGVAIDAVSLEMLQHFGTSLVWCPSSNLFTLGRTLSDDVVRSGLPVALGTDSGLTGDGDLLDELVCARRVAAAPRSLFEMVTTGAARMLRLTRGEGAIREYGVADLVAVMDRGGEPAEAVHQTKPELVIVGGRIKLISQTLFRALPPQRRVGLEALTMEGRGDFLVDANVAKLHAATTRILGKFRLAGKRVFV